MSNKIRDVPSGINGHIKPEDGDGCIDGGSSIIEGLGGVVTPARIAKENTDQ